VTRGVRCALAVVTAAVAVGCGGSSGRSAAGAAYPIVVTAPLTSAPWVGRFVERGARLAVDEVNANGGVGSDHRRLRLVVLDDGGSPRAAADDARQAVAMHAAALVTDGAGALAVANVSGPAQLPVFVVFDGGASIIDPKRRPTLFRIAPADQTMAVRLADYVSARHPKVGLITDDSSYGRDGASALAAAFMRDHIPVVGHKVVPADGSSVAPEVLAVRRSGATILVVWGSSPVVAESVRAARSSGWQAPVFTGPTGEDPLVRRQLAGHSAWVNGMTFVSFRITAEVGPKPYDRFRAAYEQRFGVEHVGVTQGGTPVVQPPDWAMFSYDAVRLVAASLAKAGAVGAPLMSALDDTVIVGANGDERGFVPGVREGVSSDDMYFATFHGFRFVPVTDDVLSEHLPSVAQ
jgi:ABC-type branched-subunit amino acid transport system substrate-binding protein